MNAAVVVAAVGFAVVVAVAAFAAVADVSGCEDADIAATASGVAVSVFCFSLHVGAIEPPRM